MVVLIDGRRVEVAEGATALEAIRTAGLDVPTACHDPRLAPSGACRLCLVRVKGQARPVAACAMPTLEGMEIEVDTPDLDSARRGALQMLARAYPKDQAVALPEKLFHRWLAHYDIEPEGPEQATQIDATNPYFRFSPEACIKCYRCVRICDDVQGSFVWNVLDRAGETHVIPDSLATLAESSCRSCGACVDACPTGALVDKTRIDQGEPDQWTKTTCPYCGVGCELSVGTKGNRIVQVLPVLDSPVNKGHLCVKGRYAHQYVHSPDRLTQPMIRRGRKLEPASWDEAVDLVAAELLRLRKAHGPDSIGVLGSARAPNEDNYLAQKFARTMIGTNNVDCCARVCHGPTAAAMKVMLGTGAATNSFDDLELAGTILVVGCNPTENHPIVGERILQAARRGTKLIVIDPRRINLADYADIHLPLKPGTNVPLLNAMAHVIVEEGLTDDSFVRDRTEGYEALREFLREWTPERVAPICGVDRNRVRDAARLYATSGPAMALHGLGVTEHYQGTEGVMCVVNLALLTGNIGIPGGGVNPLRGQNNVQGSAHMGCEPNNLTGFVSLNDGKQRFEEVWGVPVPLSQGRNLVQMLEGEPVHALWAIGYDVHLTHASAAKTAAQLSQIEFVIVQDLFLNETAKRFAHVVLPAASSFEREGTFMNAERRVQLVRKAIDAPGEALPDWQIIQRVAKHMANLSSDPAIGEAARGFEFASANEIWEEVRRVWLPGAGISYERLEDAGIQWPCTSETHGGTQTLHQTSFPLGPRASLRAIEFTPTSERVSQEFPFLLNTGRTLTQFNAGTMTGRTLNRSLRESDTLDIHPDDAHQLGIAEGERVRVVSRYGIAELPAHLDRRLRPGELFATFHSPEIFLNLITSGVQDKTVGTPEYKVTAVRLERPTR